MSIGSRNKLGEGFLADWYADWREGVDGFTDEQLVTLLAAARDALGISEESAAERTKGTALQ